MRLFYCPVCGKEEIRSDNPYKNEKTVENFRDGFGRPITHYKCECGNYLARSMDVTGWETHMVQYCKDIIKGYNKGGCYYDDNYSLSGDDGDLFEEAKRCYEKRKEATEAFLKQIHWYEQCDKNKGDQCEHRRCKYSVLSIGQEITSFCGRIDK